MRSMSYMGTGWGKVLNVKRQMKTEILSYWIVLLTLQNTIMGKKLTY